VSGEEYEELAVERLKVLRLLEKHNLGYPQNYPQTGLRNYRLTCLPTWIWPMLLALVHDARVRPVPLPQGSATT